jgi:hypothetical protein
MSGGFTISPVYDEATGAVTDFEVDGGYNGYRTSQDEYVELNDGSVHHQFENVSLQEEGEFNPEEYYETLASSDPRIPAALQWSATNLPPELIQQYNDALDNDDTDTVNQLLEYILEQYPEDEYINPEDEYTEEDDDYELTEEDQAVVDAIVDDMSQQPALGEEVAQSWQEAVYAAEQAGDDTYAGIAAATASYHAGQVSAEEAINFVLENYNIKDIARVYKQLR